MSGSEALPHLSEEAQQRHATMVLGGWRFEKAGSSNRPYRIIDPQGRTVAARFTLLTAVYDAWYSYGGNGK